MKAVDLIRLIGAEFYTGVPDSQLKALCTALHRLYTDDPRHHVTAANEGNAAALAAGYYLATGKPAVVYLQNSGEGNLVNPAASLLSDRVYAIPVLYIVGWRGEPGVHDEPQHVFQGEITRSLLRLMEIQDFVISPETTLEEAAAEMARFRELFAQGKSAAFVIRKGALTDDGQPDWRNGSPMTREALLREILAVTGHDPIVSTTGKCSRELFELREARGEDHSRDFLTVGSMGHASSIALGLALQKPERRVWCVDGDGAFLMHMGAAAVIARSGVRNLIHIVLNNGSHETVGGMPTAAAGLCLREIARACGYPCALSAESAEEVRRALQTARDAGTLAFVELKCTIGARADLGRPTTTPIQNRDAFMAALGKKAGRA